MASPRVVDFEAQIALRSPGLPVDLRVDASALSVSRPVPVEPAWLRLSVPAHEDGLDMSLAASPRTSLKTRRPLYVVREVRFTAGRPWRLHLAQAAATLFGVVAFVALFARGLRGPALAAGLLGGALAAAGLVTLVEPILWLRFAPATREALRLLALGAVSGLALRWSPSRRVAVAATAVVTGLLFFPSLGNGLVDDDFIWARSWSPAEVASTFMGSEDPTGLSNAYYRPLASLSHALDYGLFGLWPPAFHLSSVFLRWLAGLAALVFLRRVGLSPLAALAGVLAWIAHPLGASAVAWISQRTDILCTLFFLAALACLAAPSFARAQGLWALGFTLLALGSKEMAMTLPAVAFVLVRFVLPEPERRHRLPYVWAMALLIAVYLAGWAALFPERLASRLTAPGRWAGFEPGSPSFWLRLVPGLLGPILLPTDYSDWWQRGPRQWSWPELLAPCLAGPLAVWLSRRGGGRTAAFGLAWPFLVFWPLLGLRTLDLYRLGLPLCISAALIVGGLAAAVETRSRALAGALAVATLLWLAPKTSTTAAAWGPGGFYFEMMTRWRSQRPEWVERLPPASRALFLRQVAEQRARPRIERPLAGCSLRQVVEAVDPTPETREGRLEPVRSPSQATVRRLRAAFPAALCACACGLLFLVAPPGPWPSTPARRSPSTCTTCGRPSRACPRSP